MDRYPLDRITADIRAFLGPALTLDEAPPSRVIHLEELDEPKAELRSCRFRVAASPVDLPADPEWRRYLESFDRVHCVPATLRVAGSGTSYGPDRGCPTICRRRPCLPRSPCAARPRSCAGRGLRVEPVLYAVLGVLEAKA
ncbi:hypothetical protein J2Z78_005351 [Streptomyces griseorubens]